MKHRWTLALAALALLAHAATPALNWQAPIDVARGRGERGPWQQNESRYDFVDDPAVALDDRGEAALAWVDQARKAVLFQRYGVDGKPLLARPVDVSRQPRTFSWLPRVVLSPQSPQQVYVIWQEIIFSGGSHGGEILFARSLDGGRTFEPPLNLSNSMPGDGKGRITRDVWHNGSFDLVAAPGGVLYAAWTEYDGPLWFRRSLDGGRSFSAPSRIAGGPRTDPARAPALAVGADGAVLLAWTVGENVAADIHLARSTDGGRSFGAARRIAPSPQYSDAPKLAVDGRGVLHLAYAESRGGPFERHTVRYLRSHDGGRNFETPRELSRPLPAGFDGAGYPALALDGRGRVYVSWELYPTGRVSPHGLALALSADGGDRFGVPVLVPGSDDAGGGANGSSQGLLMNKLAVNRAGAVALANSALRTGAHSRVWLMRASP